MSEQRRPVQLEIVKVLRSEKASHKTFLVRRLDQEQGNSTPSLSNDEDLPSEERVDTYVNESAACFGEQLQVMKLFDRSET